MAVTKSLYPQEGKRELGTPQNPAEGLAAPRDPACIPDLATALRDIQLDAALSRAALSSTLV